MKKDKGVMPTPEQSQIDDAIEVADGKFGSRDAIPERTGHARTIFTQQLIHDIQANTRALNELEETVDRYAFWSRLFTIVLIVLSAILVIQNFFVLL